MFAICCSSCVSTNYGEEAINICHQSKFSGNREIRQLCECVLGNSKGPEGRTLLEDKLVLEKCLPNLQIAHCASIGINLAASAQDDSVCINQNSISIVVCIRNVRSLGASLINQSAELCGCGLFP